MLHRPSNSESTLLRQLFLAAGVGIAIAELDGRYVDANPVYLRMVGLNHDELMATDFLALTHPDDRDENRRLTEELRAGERESFVMEKRYLTREGDEVWCRATVALIRGPDGAAEHFVATTEDITERRHAEERLAHSESLRRVAGGLAGVGGWSIDAGTREVVWTEELYQILGADRSTALPLEDGWSLYQAGDRERLQEAIERCLVTGEAFDLDVEMDTLDGERIWARIVADAERGHQGTVTRVMGAFQDITAAKASQAEVAELARRLETTFESMTDAVFIVDHRWRFTYLNTRAEQLLLRPRHELIGRDVWAEFPEAVGSLLYTAYHDAVATGEPQTVEDYYEPLSTWFEVNAYPGPDGLAVYFRDVTERHEQEQALRRREEELARQAALLDAASDAIGVWDLHHRVTYWNASASRLYGFAAAEAVGADVRELLSVDPEPFGAAMEDLLRHGEWSGEAAHRAHDGARILVESRWTLVRDADGEPEAVLAVSTDITERKRLEEQYLRAQRMESLGTLAGGIAHDLNNMLSPILLATELLREAETDAARARMLDTVHDSARRGADLVTQVLSFARGVDGQRQPLAAGELIDDIARIVRETFPRQIALHLDVADELPVVIGDSTQLHQVLLNLVVNARDALPGGGTIGIAAYTADLDAHYVAQNPHADPGPHLVIEVQDDGFGMPPEVVERIFEPFFTTKPHGTGTGLGLSTASAIVRSHRGFLQVYSDPAGGTIIRVYLPTGTRAEASRSVADEAVGAHPRGAGELVLVVDDEAAVREITRQTLETYGYRVLEASDGAEAVSVFARNLGEVDVVVTDMMMPIMDGPATIHTLRRLAPEVRIVAASGLNGNGRVTQAADAGVRHFLPKPYSAGRLLTTIRDVLDEGPSSA